MSYYLYEDNFVCVADGEYLTLGTFQPDVRGVLRNVLLQLYRHGSAGGSETFNLQFYGVDPSTGLPDFASDTLTISDIAASEGTKWTDEQGWIGKVRFDFGVGAYLDPGQIYAVVVRHQNYTRNGDTYYLGWRLVYNQSRPTASILAPDIEVYYK